MDKEERRELEEHRVDIMYTIDKAMTVSWQKSHSIHGDSLASAGRAAVRLLSIYC